MIGWLRRLLGLKARTAAPVPTVPADGWPTLADMPALLEAVECRDPVAWAQHVHAPLALRAIHTPQRVGAYLATIMHESAGGARLVEALSYSTPERLMQVWPSRFRTLADAQPFVRNPQGLANRVFAGRLGNGPEASGDGWRYRGRGLIQITGRDNYAAAAQAFGRLLDEGFLAWCETRQGAAQTAAWWWSAHGCNALADAGDMAALRRRVNGPAALGLDDVERRRAKLAMVR